MARNDKTASQWIAPAGVTNGFLSRALSVEYSASLEERDELYSITKKNNVNPIIEILGRGVVIWGQKTTQRALTSLNRVNVVRMVGYVRKKVKQIAMDLVFAPNDSTTWASFVARVTKLLTTIETGRGLSGFKVVMDGTNNPPETIAQGKLFGSIWLKPTIVAEQIELTYTIVGQDFKFN
jgi:phage tail sheath protein FI